MSVPDGPEIYISVDIESAGPIPVDYSLLSIGACLVSDIETTFYVELKPINDNFTAEAADVHKLSLERLAVEGVPPVTAMQRFEEWVHSQVPEGKCPVFVAFNAPFDWMFVNYYFLHYLRRNPFGHAALDIKAYYMGQTDVAWSRTSWRYLSPHIEDNNALTHHALRDAQDQARLFETFLLARKNTPIT
jgi:hypothetical protein